MSPDLAADLRTLHEAGKVASPWVWGMAAYAEGYSDIVRIIDIDLGVPVVWEYRGVLYDRDNGSEWSPELAPHLLDPATVGALTALVREAANRPVDVVVYSDLGRWDARDRTDPFAALPAMGSGPTEADAIVAAIHALAEECRHAAR
jgi:hypothetical protein